MLDGSAIAAKNKMHPACNPEKEKRNLLPRPRNPPITPKTPPKNTNPPGKQPPLGISEPSTPPLPFSFFFASVDKSLSSITQSHPNISHSMYPDRAPPNDGSSPTTGLLKPSQSWYRRSVKHDGLKLAASRSFGCTSFTRGCSRRSPGHQRLAGEGLLLLLLLPRGRRRHGMLARSRTRLGDGSSKGGRTD